MNITKANISAQPLSIGSGTSVKHSKDWLSTGASEQQASHNQRETRKTKPIDKDDILYMHTITNVITCEIL
jgi:hypothetical protein